MFASAADGLHVSLAMASRLGGVLAAAATVAVAAAAVVRVAVVAVTVSSSITSSTSESLPESLVGWLLKMSKPTDSFLMGGTVDGAGAAPTPNRCGLKMGLDGGNFDGVKMGRGYSLVESTSLSESLIWRSLESSSCAGGEPFSVLRAKNGMAAGEVMA
ncbi:hypothetical protein Ahia01_000468500 [Argonauta hians]